MGNARELIEERQPACAFAAERGAGAGPMSQISVVARIRPARSRSLTRSRTGAALDVVVGEHGGDQIGWRAADAVEAGRAAVAVRKKRSIGMMRSMASVSSLAAIGRARRSIA